MLSLPPADLLSDRTNTVLVDVTRIPILVPISQAEEMMSILVHNKAGGSAFLLDLKATLAQLVTTGTLNHTCYINPQQSLAARVLHLADIIEDTSYISKLAYYTQVHGLMKDMPALLVAWLACNADSQTFHKTFDAVINNAQMVRKFVGMMRDGTVGRKSLGNRAKKAVQRWFSKTSPETLYWQSIGQHPSLKDVIKLAHPRPDNEAKNAMLAYLIGQQLPKEYMPERIAEFEAFKKDLASPVPELPVPDVPFMRLTALPLNRDHWKQIARNMTWNQLRLNLNTLQRHDVFKNPEDVEFIAAKLADPKAMPKHILPFALFSTYEYLDSEVPRTIRDALSIALINSLNNAPSFNHEIIVAVDRSTSMRSSVTGGNKSKLSCSKAAAFFAAGLYMKNPTQTQLVRFNTKAEWFTGRGSLPEITVALSTIDGGTDTSSVLELLEKSNSTAPLVIIISDNESWVTSPQYRWNTGTHTLALWDKYQERTGGKSKLICWNIQPYETTQTPDRPDILNVGGFSDAVFQIIKFFDDFNNAHHWVEIIETINF